jgi:hypothetical protein
MCPVGVEIGFYVQSAEILWIYLLKCAGILVLEMSLNKNTENWYCYTCIVFNWSPWKRFGLVRFE